MKKRYIVIGTSAAGIGFLNKLVQLEPNAEIICISNEKEVPYNKCFLADYLAQRGDRNRIYTKSLDFFNQHNISLKLDTHVHQIDASKQIIMSSAGSFEYDYLFLGLGASPIKPSIQHPAELKGIFSFYNLADIIAIEEYISKHSVQNVLVVGAGLSGLECADALYQRGYPCTVVERSSQILSSLLNADAALFLANKIENFIPVMRNTTVKELRYSGNVVTGAIFDDQSSIDANMIIFALGSKPNISVTEQTGITIEQNAILVNEYMQTSMPNIYAGGDCIVAKNSVTGQLVRSCTWPDAMLQGLIAAQNCAGGSRAYSGIVPLVSSHFFGIQFASTGCYKEQPTSVQHIDSEYEAIWQNDGKVKGFQLVGSAKRLPLLRRALLTGQSY